MPQPPLPVPGLGEGPSPSGELEIAGERGGYTGTESGLDDTANWERVPRPDEYNINVYGWYYDEWGNIINGETGETFIDLDWETQELFYRVALEGIGLTETGEAIYGEISPEIEKWVGSVELQKWALDQAQAIWENEVVEAIGPRNVEDPIIPQRQVGAPWHGPPDAVPTFLSMDPPPHLVTSIVGPGTAAESKGPPLQPQPEETYTPEESYPNAHKQIYQPGSTQPEATPVAPAFNFDGFTLPPRESARIYRERASEAISTPGGRENRFTTQRKFKPPARKQLPSWMLDEVF